MEWNIYILNFELEEKKWFFQNIKQYKLNMNIIMDKQIFFIESPLFLITKLGSFVLFHLFLGNREREFSENLVKKEW